LSLVALRSIAIQKYTLWAEFLTLSVVVHSVTTERWGVKHHSMKTSKGKEIKFHVFFIRILNWPVNSALHPGIFPLMKQQPPLVPRDLDVEKASQRPWILLSEVENSLLESNPDLSNV
jgi:hypothetical protein